MTPSSLSRRQFGTLASVSAIAAMLQSQLGAADKAASQRGKQSMPSGVPAKAKKPSKPAKR